MNHIRESRSISIFIAVTFAITWLLLGIAVVSSQRNADASSAGLITLATLGPILGAVVATVLDSGWKGVRILLAQILHWKFRPIWYAIVLLGPAIVVLTSVGLSLALGGPRLPMPSLGIWLSIPIVFVVMALAAWFEETGWRGFILPRLEKRYGMLGAGLLIGLIWGFWHLPIWFIRGAGFDSLPFPVFLVFTVCLSTIFAWIYTRTGGGLLLTVLAHAAINSYVLPWNMALSTLPETARGLHPQIVMTITLAIACIILVVSLWRSSFSKLPSIGNSLTRHSKQTS
jgi:membrane protease YdiL (CAAX protease family)